MGKKDLNLNFKSKRYKHGFWMQAEKKHKRLKAVICVLLFAAFAGLITGGLVYYFSEYTEEDPNVQKLTRELISAQKESEAGPFGLWELPEEEPQITEAPIVEETFMADFVDTRTPVKMKGIYTTSDGIVKKLDDLLSLIERTELNTIIMDIKDDDGRIAIPMTGEKIEEFGTTRTFIPDIKAVISKLKEHNIYVVARVVCFKDPLLGKIRPDLALHNKDGSIYKDYSNLTWLNPYNQEILDYLVEIAEQCAELGFDEINFDYMRFPTDGKIDEMDLGPGNEDKTKIDAVTQAVKYLCEQIKPMGLYVSGDVFGGIITSKIDQRNVGQDYAELSKYLDYICPMIYPSHYANGYYGIDYPDTQPYKLMYYALKDSKKVIDTIGEGRHQAIVRPWLQDFTASWLKHHVKYGKKEVRDQIDAVYDAGYEEWLLWNAAMNYTEGALMTEEDADYAFTHRPTPTLSPTPTPKPNATPTPKPNTGQYFDSPWKSQKDK